MAPNDVELTIDGDASTGHGALSVGWIVADRLAENLAQKVADHKSVIVGMH